MPGPCYCGKQNITPYSINIVSLYYTRGPLNTLTLTFTVAWHYTLDTLHYYTAHASIFNTIIFTPASPRELGQYYVLIIILLVFTYQGANTLNSMATLATMY